MLIRSIQEILINEKCEQLITKPKTGLSSMIQSNDVESLKNLYKLVKKTSHQKILARHYQHYIENKIQD